MIVLKFPRVSLQGCGRYWDVLKSYFKTQIYAIHIYITFTIKALHSKIVENYPYYL